MKSLREWAARHPSFVSLGVALSIFAIAGGCGGGGGGGGRAGAGVGGVATGSGSGSGTATGAGSGTGTGAGAGAGSGAGSSAGSSATGSGSGAATGSTVSQTHWQTALAALGSAHAPQPVFLDPAGLAGWNDLIARNWPAARALVQPALEAALRQSLVGQGLPPVTVQAVRNVAVDTAAPPALRGAGGSSATAQVLTVEVPAAPGAWRLAFTADVGTQVATSIAGFPITATITIDVTVEVADVRVVTPVTLDVANPARPAIVGAGAPQASLRLTLSSSNPLLAQVTGVLTRFLDPVIRAALVVGSVVAQQQVGIALTKLPQAPWGTGNPPAAPVAGAPPLEPLAVSISEAIQRDHMPFDTVLPAIFDRAGAGNGAVSRFYDHGDSACWTGHYLAAEAFRFDITGGDARAQAGATRALRGLAACLDVAAPGDGLLSRCAIPLASPHVQAISGGSTYFVGTVNGVAHGALEEISRDQYLGTLLGLSQTWLRVPALRAQAAALIGRMTAYLERNDWIAYRVNRPGELSAPFGQTPAVAWSFMRAGAVVDPARFAALAQRYEDLTSILWFAAFGSGLEVHEAYYKFNLQHAEMTVLATLETDPARYRDYVRVLDIARDAVGHHDNAWFDAVYALAVPSAAPALGSRVKNALDRWALRNRRAEPVALSGDPTIARATYSGPLFTSGLPVTVAVHPIPVEKRPPTDFLWQRSPFELDGGLDAFHQYPGIDLVLPYWAARAYGFVR